MDRSRINVAVSTVVAALAEAGGEGPAGFIYMALQVVGYTFDEYQTVEGLLLSSGCATKEFDVLRLTPKGQQFAADIERLLAKQREEKANGA